LDQSNPISYDTVGIRLKILNVTGSALQQAEPVEEVTGCCAGYNASQ
jgi:hypothetical protein